MPAIFVLPLVSNNLITGLWRVLTTPPPGPVCFSSDRRQQHVTPVWVQNTKYKIQHVKPVWVGSLDKYVQVTSSKYLITTSEWYLHVMMCKNLSKWYYEHLWCNVFGSLLVLSSSHLGLVDKSEPLRELQPLPHQRLGNLVGMVLDRWWNLIP